MQSEIIEEYPLTKIPIDKLQLDESNPNRPTKEQIAAIRKSFQRFGFLVPIIINENYEIGDGEHRALIYKELGIQEIPAYIVPKINNDIERRLLRQTMNKLRGEHDIKLDADEIALIFQNDKLDNLAELIAQGRESLENILTKHKGIMFQHEDNFDVDKALEDLVPETKLGEIWQLGQHRLICADCTDNRSLDRLIGDKECELLLTDPPYGISIVKMDGATVGGSKPNTIGHTTNKSTYGYVGASRRVKANPYRPIEGDNTDFNPEHLLDLGKNQIIFGANYFANKLRASPCWLVWYKRHEEWDRNNFAEVELAWTSYDTPAILYNVIWMGMIKEGEGGHRVHPTQKPIRLFSQIIDDFTKEGDIILDPYLGSGSTLIACEQTNRICYGCEIDPHYVDVICKRYEAYTGNKAKKVSAPSEQEAAVI